GVSIISGSTVELAGCGSTHVEPGDTLVIETPGGGGYGPASTSARRRR
ncbi:hydantoinase B/oxoprolinase family protein, partial [Mycobacterium tuberculosis]